MTKFKLFLAELHQRESRLKMSVGLPSVFQRATCLDGLEIYYLKGGGRKAGKPAYQSTSIKVHVPAC